MMGVHRLCKKKMKDVQASNSVKNRVLLLSLKLSCDITFKATTKHTTR